MAGRGAQNELDESNPIQEKLSALGSGWSPVPVSFRVVIIGIGANERYHRGVWDDFATGEFELVVVPNATHRDLVHSFSGKTAAAITRALRREINEEGTGVTQ